MGGDINLRSGDEVTEERLREERKKVDERKEDSASFDEVRQFLAHHREIKLVKTNRWKAQGGITECNEVLPDRIRVHWVVGIRILQPTTICSCVYLEVKGMWVSCGAKASGWD